MFLCFVCNFINAQIIINELQSNSGNNEGIGGDWIELKNIGISPVDLSCWRLTNGLSVVLSFPSGLILAPNNYLLIGNSSKMMCSTCDYPSLNNQFTLNTSGFGSGSGNYSNTLFLNTDIVPNGGCGCLSGTGNYNNGSGTGDRVVLFNDAGIIQDAMLFANGAHYGSTPLNVNFVGIGVCPVASYTVPPTTDTIYNGRKICNDLASCNSSYARLPDGNNGATVSYDQSGNLACTNCLLPCASSATNTASTDNPTPGLSNAMSANTWNASLNGVPISSVNTTITVCGATPINFEYQIKHFTNVALTATQASGNLGSYYLVNGGLATTFTGTNYNASTGVTTLSATLTPPNGTTTYDFVWGDRNALCTTCPGSNATSTPANILSTAMECYTSRQVTVIRENALGGTGNITCSSTGTISINGFTGTNIQYILQKQITSGGIFTTVSGPFTSNIIAGVIDDDADPTLPNYQVLVSTNNTVCPNLAPVVVAVPNACLGNPVCPKFATSGAGIPTFSPPPALAPVCANSNVQFNVDIRGVCTTGQLEVLYDFSPSFDPYTSGTSLGTTGTTVGTIPPASVATGKVFINEFVVRPAINTCLTSPDGAPNLASGEWVELYNAGPTSTDISGWVLADGDWTATIPAGTVMPSGGFYLIGGSSTFCSSGTLPDLNIETCNCANVIAGSDMMNLTNGSEQVALFDCAGTFIDGVLWGGGQGLPDNSLNNAPAGGCGNYIPAKSVSLPVAASFANSGSVSSPNSGKYRDATNAWITSTVSTITPKASNPTGQWNGSTVAFGSQCPPPPVTANITVTLPDTCSQTSATLITLKAIYKPMPTSPCTTNDVTATATYQIPTCELMTTSGNGDYCEPANAPITLNVSSALAGNYTVTLSNGINTNSLGPITGVGPFTTNVSQTGIWAVSNVQAPTGVCPPKQVGEANIQINAIPVVASSPSNVSFCYQSGFDLSTVQPSINTIPPTTDYVWYEEVTGGAPISTFVNPLQTDTFYFAPTTASPSNCESTVRTPLIVDVNPIPDIPSVTCDGITATFIPTSPNCIPNPCVNLEYSANGIQWAVGPTFTASDPGWAAFGSPSNSLVYIRNAANPNCFVYVTYFSPCAAPLPTTLFQFTAHQQADATVLLQWKTSEEKNMGSFVIERSSDGIHFYKIGDEFAKGNTSIISTYQHTDSNPLGGSNYYRLKMIDKDGQYAYSNILQINRNSSQSDIFVYPNPANEKLFVVANVTESGKALIRISDLMGRILYQANKVMHKGNNETTLDISSIVKGNYILQIALNKETFTRKFLKE